MRAILFLGLLGLIWGGMMALAHASNEFAPPSGPLDFVQGKRPQTRTGGELEVVGNKVIVSEAAHFDTFGQREVGDVAFEIEAFRIEPSDDQKHGFTMRVSGTKHSVYPDGRRESSTERWTSFNGLRFNGNYR